jgi:hypothetical protein
MTPEQFTERARTDPAWFMRDVLGAELWERQTEIVESVRDHAQTAVPACHASGKSYVAARIVLWFLYSYPGAKVITTAPTARQVESVLWAEIGAAHAAAKIPLGGDLQRTRLRLDADWWAIGITASEYSPDKLQGIHSRYILAVLDEASGISDAILQQVLSIVAGGEVARVLYIGNPLDAVSPFRHVCASPDVNTIPISVFETPNFVAFGLTQEDFANGTWREKVTDDAVMPQPFLVQPEFAHQIATLYGVGSSAWESRVDGSFPTIVEGSYYGDALVECERTGRVSGVPFRREQRVSCAFDLGIDDLTAIWFWQWAGQEIHWINYLEGNGVSMVVWAERIEKLGYQYDRIILPHDARAREKGTGKSIFEVLQARGLPVEIAPDVQVYDGIEAARMLFSRSWFDAVGTQLGRSRLSAYRRERDPRSGTLREKPTHDISSHGADAFRYAAVSMRSPHVPATRSQQPSSWLAS